ncbi:hypothetical protein PoB_001422800 [Plakobranchus ocellatus]|uniref:C2H2-type domain-containing protein n=1 Tax=Plakobranchus ocellatus TaxID=259542 RepID=A0AAV3YYX4_9GAST|nr:hypothetical protein PoB_001422800 [Plakobranchus ocellatus]
MHYLSCFFSIKGHLNSDVDEALVQAEGVGEEDDGDEDDDSPLNNIVVPTSLEADDEDDPIASLAVSASSDPSQVLHHHHQVSALVVAGPGEEEDEDVGEHHPAGLGQSRNVVTLEDGHVLSTDNQLVQAGDQEGILLATDADGNLAVPVSAEHVIRFLMQTSDGNVVAANAPVEAIKLSMPGLVSGEGGEITQTVQALTLLDGTTTLIGAPQKEEPGSEEQQPMPKFVEGQTIKLEDGTTALLQASHPEAAAEGIQAIQLEDGSTAFISHTHTDGLLSGTVNQLDPSLHLDHLANQTMLAAVDRQSEKALVIGDKAYKCMYEDCGRLYTTYHHLKVHERSHTGDRPFQCEFPNCGKSFATGYGLKSHKRVHTGEKPYPCPHTDKGCEKAFKTSGDLQKHVRTHTGERPFKCPFEGCTQSFTTSNIRKVHIRTHTGERPYICDVEGCGRAFASATNYKNHIRIHTGEKPYVCSIRGCGKRFTEYSSLYKHNVVHTHTKPYTCHCGKTYRQTSTLAMHKRTAHGEDSGILVAPQENESGEPPAKKRLIKTEALSQDSSAHGQGHLLVNANGGSQQMVLLTQSINPSTSVTSTTTTSINAGAGIEETSDNSHHHHHHHEQQQQQQQQMAGIVTLQDNLQGLQSVPGLQGIPGLQNLQGLTGLAVTENGQQVLVITDSAQLEALQQLTQHLEILAQTAEGSAQMMGVQITAANNSSAESQARDPGLAADGSEYGEAEEHKPEMTVESPVVISLSH